MVSFPSNGVSILIVRNVKEKKSIVESIIILTESFIMKPPPALHQHLSYLVYV